MKSHRKHAPNLNESSDTNVRIILPKGYISPDGKKRRLDKLKAAEHDFWFWYEVNERDRADRYNCKYKKDNHRVRNRHGRVVGTCYHGFDDDRSFYRSAERKYNELWEQAKRDKII